MRRLHWSAAHDKLVRIYIKARAQKDKIKIKQVMTHVVSKVRTEKHIIARANYLLMADGLVVEEEEEELAWEASLKSKTKK